MERVKWSVLVRSMLGSLLSDASPRIPLNNMYACVESVMRLMRNRLGISMTPTKEVMFVGESSLQARSRIMRYDNNHNNQLDESSYAFRNRSAKSHCVSAFLENANNHHLERRASLSPLATRDIECICSSGDSNICLWCLRSRVEFNRSIGVIQSLRCKRRGQVVPPTISLRVLRHNGEGSPRLPPSRYAPQRRQRIQLRCRRNIG